MGRLFLWSLVFALALATLIQAGRWRDSVRADEARLEALQEPGPGRHWSNSMAARIERQQFDRTMDRILRR